MRRNRSLAVGGTPTSGRSPRTASVVQTVSAGLPLGTFAGADPVLQVFIWLSGLAAVAIMLAASVAVIVFVRRTTLTADRGTPGSPRCSAPWGCWW